MTDPTAEPRAMFAPVVNQVVLESSEGPLMRRRLDPTLARDELARSAFTLELEAGVRVPRTSRWLAGVVSGRSGSDPWLERSYSPLGTLADLLRTRPPSTAELVTIGRCVIEALGELHRLGLAHGDPCPPNLLLTTRGTLMLADAVSCRRAFATGNLEGPTRAGDIACFLVWFERLVRTGTLSRDDSVRLALLTAIAPANDSDRYSALGQVLITSSGSAAPLKPGTSPPPSAAAGPTRVLLTIPFMAESAHRQSVARKVSSLIGERQEAVEAGLAEAGVIFETTFPEPARRLTGALRSLEVRPGVHPAGLGFPARWKALAGLEQPEKDPANVLEAAAGTAAASNHTPPDGKVETRGSARDDTRVRTESTVDRVIRFGHQKARRWWQRVPWKSELRFLGESLRALWLDDHELPVTDRALRAIAASLACALPLLVIHVLSLILALSLAARFG